MQATLVQREKISPPLTSRNSHQTIQPRYLHFPLSRTKTIFLGHRFSVTSAHLELFFQIKEFTCSLKIGSYGNHSTSNVQETILVPSIMAEKTWTDRLHDKASQNPFWGSGWGWGSTLG